METQVMGSNYASYGVNGRSGSDIVQNTEVIDRLSNGIPSVPLFGRLPLARLIPQDVHSVVDYANAAMVGVGLGARDPRAKMVSLVLASSTVGVSALTDYRLSLAKVIPIEAHEAIDHLWGLTAIAAPFVFGYWKTSPKTAIAHVVTGAMTIVASLLTDYRAYRGVGHARLAAR